MVSACFVALINYSGEKDVKIMTSIHSDEINFYLDNTIKSIPIPGLSVMITNQNENIYSMQYGQGITENTSFALGSTSKAITATAIIFLLEEYHIELNAPASDYLHWINPEHHITILDLLNHTSGISTYETIDDLKYSGTHGSFEYSNANYNLLGKIIEAITDDTFSNYINKHIFSELIMDNSFAITDMTSQKFAQGYKSFFGMLLPCKTKIPDNDSWIQAPSGCLCASSIDMAKYLRFLLSYSGDDQQLLQLVENTGVQVDNSPAIEGVYGNSGIYGLGWISKNVNGIDILYHTGKLSNYCSLSVLIPEKNIGVSVMCNMGDFLVATNLIEKLYEGIISIIIDNSDMPNIQKSDFIKQHIIINLVMLILFALCLLPAILFGLTGAAFQLNVTNICMFLLIHIAAPIMFIIAFPVILGIPYEVVIDFAPDISLVLISCSFILSITGVWKITLFFTR